MTAKPAAIPTCTVTGDSKFVAHAGGAPAICGAVTAALRAHAPGAHRVEVRVLSTTRMAATAHLADGRTLPELRTMISDGTVTPAMVNRFAQDIANQIASSRPQQGR